MGMIPDTFHLQNGCWNCNYCMEECEYDAWPEYFCNFDTTYNARVKRADKIAKWQLAHKVDKSGICDLWKGGNENAD